MKTRIRCVEKHDGSRVYYPEYFNIEWRFIIWCFAFPPLVLYFFFGGSFWHCFVSGPSSIFSLDSNVFFTDLWDAHEFLRQKSDEKQKVAFSFKNIDAKNVIIYKTPYRV